VGKIEKERERDLVGFHFVALSGYNGERARCWRERRRSSA